MKGEGFFQKYSSRQEKNFRFSNLNTGALRFFLAYLKPHYPCLLGALAAALLVTVCTAAAPYLVMQGIDRYIDGGDLHGLTVLTLFYIGINGLLWVGSYWQSYLAGVVGEKVVFKIRQDFFAHLERLSLDFFVKQSPGGIMSRLINDVNILSDLISTGLVELIGDLFIIIAIMGMMLALNTNLALLSFITIPIIYIFTVYFGKKLREAFHEVRAKIAEINSELQENITASKVVQSMYRKETNIEKFETINFDNMKANLRAMGIFALFFPLVFLIGSLGTALVLWYGGNLAAGGLVSVGLLVAFLQYVERFHRPIREISQMFNVIQSAAASLDRIYEYLQMKPQVVEPDGIISIKEDGITQIKYEGKVEFSDVSFAYENDRPVLQKINMHFEPGSTAAIVGLTGAGKTTIVSLLAHLYEVQEGQIFIDGVDIRKIPSVSLRNILAVVPQDPFLFSTTVMDNIRYGNPSASDETVISAAESLGVHQLLMKLPEGYMTKVGRRGERLSGGQKQLIALVRVFLSNPRILVLDEATSSLDSSTEAILKKALKLMLKGRTGIIIAHRFVLLDLADQVFVLKEGNIEASGQQEQVLMKSELFRELYESQMFLEKVESEH
ncbi:ABC transporter ATP-binding protein [Candidatus Contubernalis alkaliaceticus]|uniref:ABC transporter ATP-binding protein n=1 Tax=Candidatus Contubernalis alkaliaceticus TaxID=338645 RepID=UPI001F4BCE3C|nr:ABC transporter ATP-binding protein [Candidatus Contubernalis alkalaceticus]UNC93032.1 ABC transporter ATP-binding protein [Candidatus Contubernalis alkalaceticus]